MSRRIVLSSFLLMAAIPVALAETSAVKTAPAPDDTAVNKRDKSSALPTADDQSSSGASVETTRSIRKAIVADDALSTYAHNVKIVTEGGLVYLRGPVRSASEKARVEELARKAAGTTIVKSELEISAK